MRLTSADEAVRVIGSGQRVYVHEAAMAPSSLIAALSTRAPELEDVEVVHLHTEGAAPYTEGEAWRHLRHNALFVGANVRRAVNEGRADFTPVFLSEVPQLIRDGTLGIDVALVQVSPPDRHGFVSLGVSVACARAAVDHAKVVLAEINPRVPRTRGDSNVHVDRIHAGVEIDRPLHEHEAEAPSGVERLIGEQVARLVPNGATIQVGIGKIPDGVLAALNDHEDLGCTRRRSATASYRSSRRVSSTIVERRGSHAA